MSVPPAHFSSRPSYHHGDLHRALITAARELMAEQQSWEFSLREVARRAGVSHNAPYKHFADKYDLLAELAAEGFERLAARLKDASARSATPDERHVAMGLAYFRFGMEHPVYYRLMFGSGFKALPDGLPERVRIASAEAKAVLHDAIRKGAEDGDVPPDHAAIEILALTSWSLVHGLTMLFLDRLPGDAVAGIPPDTIAEAVLRHFLADSHRR